MFDLNKVQSALREQNVDAWLLYDFRASNMLARRIADMRPDKISSRRWFYMVPANGEPMKLVHRIEPATLDHLPGSKTIYLRWQELEAGVASLLRGHRRVAMEYVARNANPYVSRVDAGTIELVKSCSVEVVCSGDLIQVFEATWDEEQWLMHQEAAKHTASAYGVAWSFIADRIRRGGSVHELDVQAKILEHFQRNGMICDHNPNVSVGPHSGDPHYEPIAGDAGIIRDGDFVLIDLWAKLDKPRAVYSDLTWTGFVGTSTPDKYERIFQIVARARDAGIQCVRDAFAQRKPLQGWQVDAATRAVIDQAGYGEFFCHRTGHSIGQETHGNGANMDGLETREERRVLPRTCFSIEPGIYFPEFGIRSETNVFVDAECNVHVTGGPLQQSVVNILKEY
jgi:Xaa-Pro aminopeptidase